MNSEKLIKSPLNYTGGKYKLLPQILPLFPNDINTFIDLFGGGFNVGINIEANRVIYNDTEEVVVDLLKNLKDLGAEKSLEILKNTINKYKLSKTNEEGFKQIRKDYNDGNKSWDMFYAMLTNAFNYQIRFNKSGEYNMPFGRDRSSFNPSLEKRFIEFVNELENKNIFLVSGDFKRLEVDKIKEDDLVYCDPPYLISTATYNENGGWTTEDEEDLLFLLDTLNENNIKFALSNVLYHKGQSNDILIEWSKRYNVHYLDKSYSNCSYQLKDSGQTVEVLITNY